MSSEKRRQREVHRYYQPWLESFVALDPVASAQPTRFHNDGSILRTTRDTAIVAFAQLGCLRLNVKRAVVTLIDSERQYILAEATKTLSLTSTTGADRAGDEIWFGSAALPRSQGVSEAALTPANYVAIDQDGSNYSAPALVVDDLTKDERYASRLYAGRGVTFYCGVPITTQAGIPIGVYTLTDDKPRNGLTSDELEFMCDMASVVMNHLESVKNEIARHQGETMVFGLGRFVEGASSLHGDASDSPRLHQDVLTASAEHAPHPKSSREQLFKGLNVTTADSEKLRGILASSHRHSVSISSETKVIGSPRKGVEISETVPSISHDTQSTHQPHYATGHQKLNASPSGTSSDRVFSRAANILRECAAADGVMFYDAVSTNLARRSSTSAFRSRIDQSTEKTALSAVPVQRDGDSQGGDTTTDHETFEDSDCDSFIERKCRLLGYSLNVALDTDMKSDVLDSRHITEKSLRRLVKKYPRGKSFVFGADGNLSVGEGDQSAATETETADGTVLAKTESGRRTLRAVAEDLKRLAPHAQSIVWLPIWDFSKQRWSAGTFLWSRRPERLLSALDDLTYLRTFANSIMVETARLDAAVADTAKSTFIANVSHELRSPLHGILGNLDILSDTKLDDFQQSLVGAIEVCGKMLTDTVDHVLDYSKINRFSRGLKRPRKSHPGTLHLRNGHNPAQSPPLEQAGNPAEDEISVVDDFDLAATVEDAIEASYASHVFRSKRFAKPGDRAQPQSRQFRDRVKIVLDIEKRESWWVSSQSDAIRRVLTNLFDNALKYTNEGTITVSLSTSSSVKSPSGAPTVPLRLTVKDTGQGMSRDFVRNHAFTPFTQESQFSVGAGLGLSIVQQIVNSLGGKIKLQSDPGQGTEIKVFLNLPRAARGPDTSDTTTTLLDRLLPETSGMKIKLLNSDGCEIMTNMYEAPPPAMALAATARAWLGIQSQSAGSMDTSKPEVAVYVDLPTIERLIQDHASSAFSSQAPVIAIAAHPLERAEFFKSHAEAISRIGPCLEILSYPIGPQKLGNAISRCIGRLQHRSSPEKRKIDSPVGESANLPFKKANIHESADFEKARAVYSPSKSQPAISKPKLEPRLRQTSQHRSLPLLDRIERTDTGYDASSTGSGDTSPARADVPMEGGILKPVTNAPKLGLGLTSSDDSQIHVLLVDDNDVNLSILMMFMKRFKLSYATAKDGLQALKAFQVAAQSQVTFTHVLMDITMPVMDGIEATRQIRQFEQSLKRKKRASSNVSNPDHQQSDTMFRDTGTLPDERRRTKAVIIALSGVVSEDTQRDMFEAGADMFLPKPAKLKELIKIIDPLR